MFFIGLCRRGSVFQRFFPRANFRFCPSGSSATASMSYLHECHRKYCTLGLPFFSVPSFRRAGWGGVVSGCSCVASRGFPLLPLDFGPAGGVEEPLIVRSVHGSSLLSPRFIRGLGIQE